MHVTLYHKPRGLSQNGHNNSYETINRHHLVHSSEKVKSNESWRNNSQWDSINGGGNGCMNSSSIKSNSINHSSQCALKSYVSTNVCPVPTASDRVEQGNKSDSKFNDSRYNSQLKESNQNGNRLLSSNSPITQKINPTNNIYSTPTTTHPNIDPTTNYNHNKPTQKLDNNKLTMEHNNNSKSMKKDKLALLENYLQIEAKNRLSQYCSSMVDGVRQLFMLSIRNRKRIRYIYIYTYIYIQIQIYIKQHTLSFPKPIIPFIAPQSLPPLIIKLLSDLSTPSIVHYNQLTESSQDQSQYRYNIGFGIICARVYQMVMKGEWQKICGYDWGLGVNNNDNYKPTTTINQPYQSTNQPHQLNQSNQSCGVIPAPIIQIASHIIKQLLLRYKLEGNHMVRDNKRERLFVTPSKHNKKQKGDKIVNNEKYGDKMNNGNNLGSTMMKTNGIATSPTNHKQLLVQQYLTSPKAILSTVSSSPLSLISMTSSSMALNPAKGTNVPKSSILQLSYRTYIPKLLQKFLTPKLFNRLSQKNILQIYELAQRSLLLQWMPSSLVALVISQVYRIGAKRGSKESQHSYRNEQCLTMHSVENDPNKEGKRKLNYSRQNQSMFYQKSQMTNNYNFTSNDIRVVHSKLSPNNRNNSIGKSLKTSPQIPQLQSLSYSSYAAYSTLQAPTSLSNLPLLKLFASLLTWLQSRYQPITSEHLIALIETANEGNVEWPYVIAKTETIWNWGIKGGWTDDPMEWD